MTNKELKKLNRLLAERYGDTAGHPNWRVVRGDFKEKSAGTFNEWYGDIFLREFIGIKEVDKYEWLFPQQYVIEKYLYRPNWEMFGTGLQMDYELVFVWPPMRLVEDQNARSFSMVEKVASALILALEKPIQYGKTVSDIVALRTMRKASAYDEYAEKILDDSDQIHPERFHKRTTNSRIVTASK